MPSGGSNQLLTPAATAERLGVSSSTLYDRYRTWGLPAYHVGKHLRFRERDIEAWLERNRVADLGASGGSA